MMLGYRDCVVVVDVIVIITSAVVAIGNSCLYNDDYHYHHCYIK